ncbi:hypothetical protein AVL57_00500 (plasmid) [Alteromonas stellipolaris]|uniref:Uncharacterized protein n=1 Tax=Alteromonas stellipolaris TaxID=233316 RepID=A0ABN4LWC0_9ALTE|nr:hypothetical protein AVL57_00500 [Alteromonas stellipolaris]
MKYNNTLLSLTLRSLGAGIAKQVKSHFPNAFQADLETQKDSEEKLGSFSSAAVLIDNHKLTIVNAYTHFHWRGRRNKADYEAIRNVFALIKENFSRAKNRIPTYRGWSSWRRLDCYF